MGDPVNAAPHDRYTATTFMYNPHHSNGTARLSHHMNVVALQGWRLVHTISKRYDEKSAVVTFLWEREPEHRVLTHAPRALRPAEKPTP